MEQTWHTIFQTLIALLVGFIGAPITQLFKNLLGKIFKTQVEDRWALLLSGVTAGGLALLEMWLSGVLNLTEITAQTFPQIFFSVFALSTIYYQLFKGSPGFFGQRTLLKK